MALVRGGAAGDDHYRLANSQLAAVRARYLPHSLRLRYARPGVKMNDIRVTVLAAFGLFMAAGLITFFWPASGTSRAAFLDQAHTAVQGTLRDPSSAQFQDEVVVGAVTARTVCGNVNAKNGFGGYTGKSAFIYEEQTKMTKIASNLDEAGSIMQS